MNFSKRAVDDVRRTGKICILDIEIEGVKQVRNTDLNPLLVFVKPPSIEELERRLRGRATEHEEALLKRLESAKREIEFGKYYCCYLYLHTSYASVPFYKHV